MLKREQYGLIFNKKVLSNGSTVSVAIQKKYIEGFCALIFINRLDQNECKGFIYDLNRCISLQRNSDEVFFSDGVEDMEIMYQYPNVNIDNVLIISMQDMKGLLEEWLEFIT